MTPRKHANTRARKTTGAVSWFRGCVAFVMLVIPAAAVAAQPAQSDVTVRTSLDRTAMWVADRVTYTIEISCKRGVDVVADDLSRDKLKIDGLEVIGGDTARRSAPDEATIYQVRYVLTTYRIDVPALTIAPLTVRYAVRRAGQRLEDAVPAGEVQVPGATIAFRSVLPDDQDLSGIRSEKPPHARPMRFAALQPIGMGLIIVSIVPALLAVAALVRRTRRPRVRRSARAVRHQARATLEAVRAMDVDTIEGRREVFTELDALVREHLREVCGVPGASLTPNEVPFALAAADATVPVELVASVLHTCEAARYAPPHATSSAEECRNTIEQVEQLIAGTGARGVPPSLELRRTAEASAEAGQPGGRRSP